MKLGFTSFRTKKWFACVIEGSMIKTRARLENSTEVHRKREDRQSHYHDDTFQRLLWSSRVYIVIFSWIPHLCTRIRQRKTKNTNHTYMADSPYLSTTTCLLAGLHLLSSSSFLAVLSREKGWVISQSSADMRCTVAGSCHCGENFSVQAEESPS